MATSSTLQASAPFVVQLHPPVRLDDDQLWDLARANPELVFERTAAGDLLIMSPPGEQAARRHAALDALLHQWREHQGSGEVLDSSSGFVLPSGAMRVPDAAWVSRERWEALTPRMQERFPPLCPDFVVEMLSPTDSRARAQEKMQEWRAAGARLGWLIDPAGPTVWIYRPGRETERLDQPEAVSADPELPGFRLELRRLR